VLVRRVAQRNGALSLSVSRSVAVFCACACSGVEGGGA